MAVIVRGGVGSHVAAVLCHRERQNPVKRLHFQNCTGSVQFSGASETTPGGNHSGTGDFLTSCRPQRNQAQSTGWKPLGRLTLPRRAMKRGVEAASSGDLGEESWNAHAWEVTKRLPRGSDEGVLPCSRLIVAGRHGEGFYESFFGGRGGTHDATEERGYYIKFDPGPEWGSESCAVNRTIKAGPGFLHSPRIRTGLCSWNRSAASIASV